MKQQVNSIFIDELKKVAEEHNITYTHLGEICKTMFLDYWNNYCTINRFAEAYNITVRMAILITNDGRQFNDNPDLRYKIN